MLVGQKPVPLREIRNKASVKLERACIKVFGTLWAVIITVCLLFPSKLVTNEIVTTERVTGNGSFLIVQTPLLCIIVILKGYKLKYTNGDTRRPVYDGYDIRVILNPLSGNRENEDLRFIRLHEGMVVPPLCTVGLLGPE